MCTFVIYKHMRVMMILIHIININKLSNKSEEFI